MGYIDCFICDQELQQSSTIYLPCCDIINNNGTNVGQNCGTVNSYGIASEYIDFHENKYRFVQKSIYQRKYQLENKLRDMQISVANLNKIH